MKIFHFLIVSILVISIYAGKPDVFHDDNNDGIIEESQSHYTSDQP